VVTWVTPDGGHTVHRRLPDGFNQQVRRLLSSIAQVYHTIVMATKPATRMK
jgi:hypothetical protein